MKVYHGLSLDMGVEAGLIDRKGAFTKYTFVIYMATVYYLYIQSFICI